MEREPALIAVEEGVRLRPIDLGDLELLREWKNRNRASFFHREEISPELQGAWFAEFLNRRDDHMFVVDVDGAPIGCMGYRVGPDDIDFYNIIRGRSDSAPGVMHKALGCLIDVARAIYPERPVKVRVVSNNPAILWYRRCGFVETAWEADHVVLTWRPGALDLA